MSLVITMLYILIAAIQPLLCSSTVLQLERTVSMRGPLNLSRIVERDRTRHSRLLYSQDGVINYTLSGKGDLSVGLYYTTLQIGTPPSSFHVQVDTGSDVTWIGCMPCTYCPPLITGIPNITLNLYNPITTSTFSALSCYDYRCPTGVRVSASNCLADNDHSCRYMIDYADKSHVSGFYVQDLLTYDRIVGISNPTVRSTVPFVFGCANVETGFYTSSKTDGILGLGRQEISLISQLAEQGLSPRVFSHCLRGDQDGGGALILGEIIESDLVYSPLIPSQPHYNLYLEGISVNDNILPIDPIALSSVYERGAIIDSGSTLVHLELRALIQVHIAINSTTTATFITSSFINQPCYLVSTSVADVFPQVVLHFAGGADLIVEPQEYLLYHGATMDGMQIWCSGFQEALGEARQTIIGDIVLKNKLVVYDLARQRIGWKNYNCSLPVNVSTGSTHERRSNARKISTMPLHSLVLAFLLFFIP